MAQLSFAQHPFLAELGLEADNLGCFDGSWFASGDFITCPHERLPLPPLPPMCDYAAGLSRMLNGQVIPSERRTPHLLLLSPAALTPPAASQAPPT